MLALPLAPKFSAKYFTGGAASAFIDRSHTAGHSTEAGSQGEEAGDDAAGGKQLRQAASAAASAVQSATRTVQAAAGEGERQGKKKSKKEGGGGYVSLAAARAAALEAALAKRGLAGASGGKQRVARGTSLVVIPRAFGRDSSGVDALDALRAREAALHEPLLLGAKPVSKKR